jgi:hypothetical protein
MTKIGPPVRTTLVVCAVIIVCSSLGLWVAYWKGIVWDRFRLLRRHEDPEWYDFTVTGMWVHLSLASFVLLAALFFGTVGPYWWRGGPPQQEADRPVQFETTN